MNGASPERIEETLKELTEGIGERLAGSSAELQAVRYIQRQCAHAGALVAVEEFPVRYRCVQGEHVEVCIGGVWRRFACSLFSNTPGTEGETIEAPLVFFETPAESRRADLSHLRGKAVVHLGCHIESRDYYRRLIEAEPAFLLFVDIRYPGCVPLADGMFPAYTDSVGVVPTVNVAYMDAWQWHIEAATRARLCVKGGMQASVSHNVVVEIPGSEPEAGIIVVGGHHDTQADSVGADDNATGTAAVVELARLLTQAAGTKSNRRTIRLVSFGAEEQLSVGSAVHVRRRRRELHERGVFMLNFDSFGSGLGWTEMVANGPPEMAEYLLEFFEQRDLYMRPSADVMPYTDHFPFVAAGVPGVSIIRYNCTVGRFFHHRPDDDISRLSLPLLARIIDCANRLLVELANADPFPFPGTIPAQVTEKATSYWEDLFNGWNPSTMGAD